MLKKLIQLILRTLVNPEMNGKWGFDQDLFTYFALILLPSWNEKNILNYKI